MSKYVDPRIGLIHTNDNAYTCPMTGRKFKFGTPAERVKATEAYIDHTNATIQRRERYAARSLSPDELLHGVQHNDPRTVEQRVKFNGGWGFTPIPSEVSAPMNPMDDPRFRAVQNPETKKEFYERVRLQYEKRVAGPAAEDPRRAKAQEVAAAAYERALFDPTATVQQVDEAKRLVKQSQGCLETFRVMHDAYMVEIDAAEALRKADLSAKIAALETERLPRYEAEPVAEVIPEPKPQGVQHTYYPDVRIQELPEGHPERVRMEQSTEAWWAARREREQQEAPQQ